MILKRQFVLNGLLLLLSLFFSLFLLETAARLYYKLTKSEAVGPLQPGSKRIHNLEFDEFQTIGSSGFRQSFFQPAESTKNILLLGDSFVFGTGLSDNQTFAWQLNKMHPDRSFQFFNGGAPEKGIHDYYALYKTIKEKLPYQFETVVLFIFIGNDIYDYKWVFANLSGKSDDSKLRSGGLRKAYSILEKFFPNSLGFIRKKISAYGKNTHKTRFRGLEAFTDYINRFRGIYGRTEPLTVAEIQLMSSRYKRIAPKTRKAMARGEINPWLFLPFISPPFSNDFVFNLDSEFDLRQTAASIEQLDYLINGIDEQVGVVIVPDKFQVCAASRQMAAQIMGPDYPGDEFSDLLRINVHIARWVTEHHPRAWVLDLAAAMEGHDACEFYYDIDCHFSPTGADFVASELSAYFH